MRKLVLSLLAVCLFWSSGCFADEKLIFAIDVIRHGDRTPTRTLPASPFDWPIGLGELTDTGVKQEYDLGTKMRENYIQSAHLLPEKYAPDTIYVRSTNVNRTLMSAESLLYGLYPLGTGPNTIPGAYQPIPIHTIKKDEETLLIPDQDMKRFSVLLVRYVFFSDEWYKKERELRPLFPRWSKLTGVPIKHLFDLLFVGDNIRIRQLHHVPLPKDMTEADAYSIVEASEFVAVHFYLDPGVGRVASRALLREIAGHFEKATAHHGSLRWVLYSAHDSTIMSLLSAMDAPTSEVPHYASDLAFWLSESTNIHGHHDYKVRILLNDEIVQIPGCHPGFCTLEEFKKLI